MILTARENKVNQDTKLVFNRKFMLMIFLTILSSDYLLSQTKTGSWGDQGNGTYINPVLIADYSDPDVIRVGEKYYMVCSEFHFMGMPVLESEDLVNWRVISQVYTKLDFSEYNTNNRYAGGSWAPTIRFHNNKYWVYFCTPDEGLFMSTAEKPEGPWAPLTIVKKVAKWEDPCPFWDEDGKAYLGHSLHGAGPIIIHKMSDDGTKLLDDGFTVYTGPVAEGTKIHRFNNYYYISIPEGGVGEGWQTILRSKNIFGPYEKKVVLETGSTTINGPHQGALVETQKGEWWFYHFQSSGAMGRVLHLQPVHWQDNWPVIGVDIDQNGIGEPVFVWKKPDIGKKTFPSAPQTDDNFNTKKLGLQWQWNHNPVDEGWSLSKKPGYLSLTAYKADSFMKARNTLTQRLMGNTGDVITEMDFSGMADGQFAGMCSMSKANSQIGIHRKGGKTFVYFKSGKTYEEKAVLGKRIYFKVTLNTDGAKNQFYYSLDNKNFQPFGKIFEVKWGYWKGSRIGLFSYNEIKDGGTASFNWFDYNYDGPEEALGKKISLSSRKE